MYEEVVVRPTLERRFITSGEDELPKHVYIISFSLTQLFLISYLALSLNSRTCSLHLLVAIVT